MLLVVAAACGTDAGGPTVEALAVLSGDHQGLVAAAPAGAPLEVRLTGQNGAPGAGVEVDWSVVAGTGHLSGITTTDTGGVSEAFFAADTVAGNVVVRARAATGDSALFHLRVVGGPAVGLAVHSGNAQLGCTGDTLPSALVAQVVDRYRNGTPGTWVHWGTGAGDGALLVDSVRSDSGGLAATRFAIGDSVIESVVATAAGLAGSPATFAIRVQRCFRVLGGGNNVPERYTSDLWLAKGYAYTGTWGFRSAQGNVVNIWQLAPNGSPALVSRLTVASNIGTVSDLQVSPDSSLLVVTGESGPGSGLYLYSLADPANPTLLGQYLVNNNTGGLHTGTLAVIGGQLYDFTARDPSGPSLLIFRIQPDSATKIVQVDSIEMPANYGIHDTYVRDGMLFVNNWNSGLWIYDIGGAGRGGSVSSPVFISSIVTGAAADGSTPAGQVHNSWWFHNGATGDKKYVFVGQEGPDVIGAQSNGDIHVVDISDIDHPTEVAYYHMGSHEGTHNFWVDEQRQILYAAYYNGGVVALDVSGALSGDLAGREIARIAPGGAGDTYVWGVMLYGGSLYAADMLSGLWQLKVP